MSSLSPLVIVCVLLSVFYVACDVKTPRVIEPPPIKKAHQKSTIEPTSKAAKHKPDRAHQSPILIAPKDAKKAPLLVMLHGYGSNHRDFVSVGHLARLMGWAALSVPAPVVLGPGRFSWPKRDPKRTHAYIQKLLKHHHKDERLDLSRVYLAGFSQGALHSTLITTMHPESYQGVMAISAAGWTDVPKTLSQKTKRPICMIGGVAERPRYRKTFTSLRALLEQNKWPTRVIEHPGGHHFPRSWKASFKQCLTFISTSSDAPPTKK